MALIQTAHGPGTGSGSAPTFTFAFASNVTAGNSIVVTVTGASGIVGNWTIAGGSDTFTQDVSDGNGCSAILRCFSSVGGYATLTVTMNNVFGGAAYGAAWAYEIAGLTALDRTSSGTSGTTTFSSGTTPTTAQPSEFFIGVGGANNGSGGTGTNATGPLSLWTNLTRQQVTQYTGVSGYQVATTTGTAVYAGTLSGTPADVGACVATYKYSTSTPIVLGDTAAAADTLAAQLTSVPPAIAQAPPRPSGPPPAPIAPQVLLVPSGAAGPQDTAAAADVFAVTAETIPLADVAAAADYPVNQPQVADTAAAADTMDVTAGVPLTDATGAGTDLAGNIGVAEINWAETGAALDKAGSAGLSEPDAAGAAETLSVAATGVAFADTAGAADTWGQAAAIGASGGASVPQAYPGTSQVAVAAPGSSTWYYLGSLGVVTALTYSFKCPGGADKMTCTVMVPASYRTQLFDDGWQVRITRGGHVCWTGVLDEPTPTATSGWNLTAAGTGNLGTNFAAVYTSTWPSGEPDQAINNAIGRGLPWVNPGVGTPAGAWFGQAVDSGSQKITDLLNLVCTRGGLTWYVNSQPGGQIGSDLSVFPLPSAPNRLLVCTTPVTRTMGGAVRTILVRYEITADNTSGTSSAPATYGLVSVSNSAAAAFGAAAVEQYLDLSDAGTMTAAQAETVAAYILEVYQQISFAGSFTARYGQLMNLGGTAIDPGTDQAGSVVRLILTDFAYGGSVIPQPVTFLVGSYMWDDFQQVATLSAYLTLNQSISSLLSLSNTLLVPIQAASG